ncbi:insulin-like growth factor-binding protein 3 receptor isoform X2 [Myotis lucifugus]|uniref:insulin-like growth factor-binding protein 3 receptor isoform X2 n=1 Tax=Myotis lucifugus TaxID=59463 RepID=UPI0006D72951|nr:insulin-like growth factor-binding protein 3 receptor isoform X2 [Myotis lucifugus]
MRVRFSVEAQTPLLPMGSCQAGHNLHLCLAHHPPLVCATLILLLLGLSGLGLGGFLLTHRTGLRSPDIPQDWVSFLRSFGQLTLCPTTATVTETWHGSHVVGLLTTLNFGDGPGRNKTQTFQATVRGSQMGLKGEMEDCGGWTSEHSGVGPAPQLTNLVTLGTSLSHSYCNED